MSAVAASVAKSKEQHPKLFCPTKRCLYRTGGGLCPRHRTQEALAEIARKRVAAGVCRHCGGKVPCWSPSGDLAIGKRHR